MFGRKDREDKWKLSIGEGSVDGVSMSCRGWANLHHLGGDTIKIMSHLPTGAKGFVHSQ